MSLKFYTIFLITIMGFLFLFFHVELENCIWLKSWEYVGEGNEMMEQRISRCRAKSRLCEAFLLLDQDGQGFVPLEELRLEVQT